MGKGERDRERGREILPPSSHLKLLEESKSPQSGVFQQWKLIQTCEDPFINTTNEKNIAVKTTKQKLKIVRTILPLHNGGRLGTFCGNKVVKKGETR